MTPESLVRHGPPVREGECLALMGSIVEGLANEQSDIDLLYLGDGELKDKIVISFRNAYKFGVSHDENGYEINVEQLDGEALASMSEGMARSLYTLDHPREAKDIAVERDAMRLRMIHRVRTCVPLVNPEVLADWRRRLRTDEFPQFLLHTHMENLLNQQEDIVGELQSGNFRSALWMAKTTYAPRLVAAMLAAAGETNQYVKWHFKLLERHRDAIGADLVDAVLGFMTREGPDTPEALLAELTAISEPVMRTVFERHRKVRRAVLAFSQTVRYNGFLNPDRWERKPVAV